MDQKDIELQINNILNKAFLQRRMTVSAGLFNRKKKELAKFLEKTGAYNKQTAKQISDKLFEAGLSKVYPSQLAHQFTKLLTDASLAGEPVAPSNIVTFPHRSSIPRPDQIIDWIDLIKSAPNITTISKTSSDSSQTSHYTFKSSIGEIGSNKLPPIQAKIATIVRPSFKPEKESITLSPSIFPSKTSNLPDFSAPGSAKDTVPLPSIKGQVESKISSSAELTSPFGSWAYTISTDIRSSEFSDRILSGYDGDLEMRRTPRKLIGTSQVTMSPFEVADHISSILEAVTNAGAEFSIVLRGVLRLLAENPPELGFLKKLAKKFQPESSVFWNDDGTNGVKLQNVLEDVILDTAAILLMDLEPAHKDRLLHQTKARTAEMLRNLAQIGTIVLSNVSTQRLFKGMELLNSGVLLGKNVFKTNVTAHVNLPDNAKRWLKPFDVEIIFRSSSPGFPRTYSTEMANQPPPDHALSTIVSQSGSEESAIIIADVNLFLNCFKNESTAN